MELSLIGIKAVFKILENIFIFGGLSFTALMFLIKTKRY